MKVPQKLVTEQWRQRRTLLLHQIRDTGSTRSQLRLWSFHYRVSLPPRLHEPCTRPVSSLSIVREHILVDC